jgi:hypothetical protein
MLHEMEYAVNNSATLNLLLGPDPAKDQKQKQGVASLMYSLFLSLSVRPAGFESLRADLKV